MGRPARHEQESLLDAALDLAAGGGWGEATVGAIASAAGAPVGSIYHRFASRELLLAALWLRTVRSFQAGFLAALALPEVDEAARAAVRHVLSWGARHPAEARLLLLHGRADLASAAPEASADLAAVNDELAAGLRSYARRRYGSAAAPRLERATLALVDLPHAAARRALQAGRLHPATVAAAQDAAVLLLTAPGGPRRPRG